MIIKLDYVARVKVINIIGEKDEGMSFHVCGRPITQQ